MARKNSAATTYDRIVEYVFHSGSVSPGTRLVEQELADHLGVSRMPVRESLRRLVGQDLLVSEPDGRGVRLRQYSTEEVRQLYELRETLEGTAARAAARAANDSDLSRLRIICQKTESEVGNYGSKRWAELDHAFHDELARASHNDRVARLLKLLLTECHYLFFGSRRNRRKLSKEVATAHMQAVVDEHRLLIDLIGRGDGDGAEKLAQDHVRHQGVRVTDLLIEMEFVD